MTAEKLALAVTLQAIKNRSDSETGPNLGDEASLMRFCMDQLGNEPISCKRFVSTAFLSDPIRMAKLRSEIGSMLSFVERLPDEVAERCVKWEAL